MMNRIIELTTEEDILLECAKMMSETEPWLSLDSNFNSYLDALHGEYKEVYIVRDKSKVVGFALLQITETFKGYIQSICISPERRGQGIGSELLEFCENKIFQMSPFVFICVSSFDTKAAKLFRKMGYKKIGEIENFIVQGYSEILLRKSMY